MAHKRKYEELKRRLMDNSGEKYSLSDEDFIKGLRLSKIRNKRTALSLIGEILCMMEDRILIPHQSYDHPAILIMIFLTLLFQPMIKMRMIIVLRR